MPVVKAGEHPHSQSAPSSRPRPAPFSLPAQVKDFPPASVPALSTTEIEIIDLFVSAVRALGLPKSVGEIYGLLFASPQPLTLDHIVERLHISKGSASQGLRFLNSLGAARKVYVAGERRDFFQAEDQLKRLVAGFIRGELRPHLESGQERLGRLDLLIQNETGPSQEFYAGRVERLRNWHSKALRLLPLLERFL